MPSSCYCFWFLYFSLWENRHYLTVSYKIKYWTEHKLQICGSCYIFSLFNLYTNRSVKTLIFCFTCSLTTYVSCSYISSIYQIHLNPMLYTVECIFPKNHMVAPSEQLTLSQHHEMSQHLRAMGGPASMS